MSTHPWEHVGPLLEMEPGPGCSVRLHNSLLRLSMDDHFVELSLSNEEMLELARALIADVIAFGGRS